MITFKLVCYSENTMVMSDDSSIQFECLANVRYILVIGDNGFVSAIEYVLPTPEEEEKRLTFEVDAFNVYFDIGLQGDFYISTPNGVPYEVSVTKLFMTSFSSPVIVPPVTETPIDFQKTLNGNFGSLEDGSSCFVVGQGVKSFTVVSSFVGWDNPDTGGLIINYVLKDENDKVITVPYVLVKVS